MKNIETTFRHKLTCQVSEADRDTLQIIREKLSTFLIFFHCNQHNLCSDSSVLLLLLDIFTLC